MTEIKMAVVFVSLSTLAILLLIASMFIWQDVLGVIALTILVLLFMGTVVWIAIIFIKELLALEK